MSFIARQKNKATIINFPLITRGAFDFENSNISFEVGDVVVTKNESQFTNTSNLPKYLDKGIFYLTLTANETNADRIIVNIIDQSIPKLWEDQAILIETTSESLNISELATKSNIDTLQNALSIENENISNKIDVNQSSLQEILSLLKSSQGEPVISSIKTSVLKFNSSTRIL